VAKKILKQNLIALKRQLRFYDVYQIHQDLFIKKVIDGDMDVKDFIEHLSSYVQ